MCFRLMQPVDQNQNQTRDSNPEVIFGFGFGKFVFFVHQLMTNANLPEFWGGCANFHIFKKNFVL